jgi:subtilisin family serine protease
LAAGARWAADNGARVISTSYSGVSSATNQTTGAYLRTKNALYCFAAGNSNTNLSTFDHIDVTVVGATDSNDAKASFSSYGLGTDVYAPGVNIFATIRTNDSSYGNMSGTSMATPMAAGVATMITASNPSLTSNQVETALYQGCDDLGPVGNDTQWGWGRININKSLRYAYNNFPFPVNAAIVNVGNGLGDALNAMNTSDDSYYRVDSDEYVSFTLRFDSTLLQVGSMELIYEDRASAAGGTVCIISSGVNGQKLDTRAVGNSDVLRSISIPNSAIEAGTGDVVLNFTYWPISRTLPTWQASVDRAVLFTRPNP